MTTWNAGYYKRPTRRVNVLRGFNGCEPETFTRVAPITPDVTIVSGDVVSLVDGAWVLGAAAGAIPYIALSDGTDTDVNAAGGLPALSCAGQFEIETARYDANETYEENTPLTAATGGDAGLVTVTTSGANTDILGYATRGGITNLNSGGGPQVEVNSETPNVLTFVTGWTLNRA